MGQNCCAISRLYIHQDIHDKLIDKLTTLVKDLKTGSPLEQETYNGSLVSKQSFDRISTVINKSKEAGLKIVTGETLPDTWQITPTIFVNVGDEESIAKEEIFGPVLCSLEPYE
jgi:acyl-CoA reductase-like NAD-dependent aldehyde dehydrogenase